MVVRQVNLNKLLTSEDLAAILATTPATIRRWLECDSQSLPSTIAAVGSRKVYWHKSDIEAWIAVSGGARQPLRETYLMSINRRR